MLDPNEFRFSKHFQRRALDMGLTPEQIADVLLHPETVSDSHKYPGSQNYRLGDLTFGVDVSQSPKVAVTAVWSNEQAWDRDMARGGYVDRERCVGFGVQRRKVSQ